MDAQIFNFNKSELQSIIITSTAIFKHYIEMLKHVCDDCVKNTKIAPQKRLEIISSFDDARESFKQYAQDIFHKDMESVVLDIDDDQVDVMGKALQNDPIEIFNCCHALVCVTQDGTTKIIEAYGNGIKMPDDAMRCLIEYTKRLKKYLSILSKHSGIDIEKISTTDKVKDTDNEIPDMI